MADQMEDATIIQKVMAGETCLFALIVRKYERSLTRVIGRYFKDSETARDVLQESFLKAYLHLHTFEGRCSFKNWLFRISVNTAKNKLRTIKYMENIDETDISIPTFIEHTIFSDELVVYLKLAVEKLPIKQKQTVELRVFDDLSFKEVAEIMDCPYDTAKANYRHALVKIREYFVKQKIHASQLDAV
jgi:RNA polymerase sigma-70 factor, ECF subfamily